MPEPDRAQNRVPDLGRVEAAAERLGEAELALDREVAAARSAGATWQDVAGVFGISRQAAFKRFAHATDASGESLHAAPSADVAALTRTVVAEFFAGDVAALREQMTQACARELNVGTLTQVCEEVCADVGRPLRMSVQVRGIDGAELDGTRDGQAPLPAVGRAWLHHAETDLWMHVLFNRAGKISGMVIRPEEMPETWPL